MNPSSLANLHPNLSSRASLQPSSPVRSIRSFYYAHTWVDRAIRMIRYQTEMTKQVPRTCDGLPIVPLERQSSGRTTYLAANMYTNAHKGTHVMPTVLYLTVFFE